MCRTEPIVVSVHIKPFHYDAIYTNPLELPRRAQKHALTGLYASRFVLFVLIFGCVVITVCRISGGLMLWGTSCAVVGSERASLYVYDMVEDGSLPKSFTCC